MSRDARSRTDQSSALDAETLSAIVERAPDAILVVAEDGSIVFANLTAEEMFGFDRADLIGKPIELLVPERLRTDHQWDRIEYMEEPAARPMGAGLELRVLCSDGSEIEVEVSLAPVASAAGSLVVAAIRDATARREAEQDRLELMNSLERQLERERVAADIHDDLIQSVFSVGLGLLEAERDDAISKADALSRARSQVSGAIADLRAYVRWLRTSDAASGDQPLVSRLRALIHGAPQGLEWTTDLDFPKRDLPAEHLRHVYLVAKELISNVHRHAEASEAAISIAVIDGAVCVRVRDNGCGFALEQVTSDSFGLDGMRRRAETFGGEVRVASSPGNGTDVQVRIPLS